MTDAEIFDLLIVGGGVNGAGIARDASGRGLTVCLCEKDDLASHTSSASTKLIHGGLRYLEHYEFRLVRESLIERETLLQLAPHIIWPLRFILPYHNGLRPAWLLRLGLFLYDHIGGRKLLPPTTRADLRSGKYAGVLKDEFSFGFEYSDCWVDDARLVTLNAVDASERGAKIMTRTECIGLERVGDHWRARLKVKDGAEFTCLARCVVNAAGPWVEDIAGLASVAAARKRNSTRLVKGSHIITEKLFDGDQCYIFQNADKRIIFAIPYEDNFTLVGTTDIAFSGDRNHIEISSEEVDYICSAATEYFATPVTPDQIVSSYAGVRALFDDNDDDLSSVTRDYVLDVKDSDGVAPILSVYGGKLTTYRKLAEHAMEKLERYFPNLGGAWTSLDALPGGDLPEGDFGGFLNEMQQRYPFLPPSHIHRLARQYGSRLVNILGSARSENDLGEHFGSSLYEAETRYLLQKEFAQTAEDILWRRTKLGLVIKENERARLESWRLAQRAE